ncbi:MAG: transglutaminase family protein [Bacteroidales bacterium]|nr:transglutaminase family protein [Bacteroidales bacterium]
MKRFFFVLCCFALVVSCSKTGPDVPKDTTFTPDTYNGYLLEQLAAAYDRYEETGDLPTYINVEGLQMGKSKYVSAACVLIPKIAAEPDTWQENELQFTSYSVPSHAGNNTYDRDSISIDDLVHVLIQKNLDYAAEKNIFPNYCTLDAEFHDEDGVSVYPTRLNINQLSLILTRVCHYYMSHSRLPQAVCVWEGDYLHSTANCNIAADVVIAARDEAIAGCETDREKAEAIFLWARDKIKYDYYANTRKGAVGTLTARVGNCCDQSHAVVAMARAAGIHARYRHAQCQYSSVEGHVMAELLVDGKWYLCDATNSRNTFGNHQSWQYIVTFNGRYNALPF